MKQIPVRKKILLSAIVLLVGIYVLQVSLGGPSGILEFSLDTVPDVIEISGGQAGSLRLSGDGSNWFVGDTREPAAGFAVQNMISALTRIRAPGRVSANAERGDFGLDSPLVVTAYASGKKLRTVQIGKSTANALQTYCRIDSGSDVYLVSGNLRSVFDLPLTSLVVQEED